MLSGKQIKKLAKARTDRDFIKATQCNPGEGAGLWHDGEGTIIFAEEPDVGLIGWAKSKGHEFKEADKGAVAFLCSAEAEYTIETYPVEIIGYTNDMGETKESYVRFVSTDGAEEWTNAIYVAAILKRGAKQFFVSKHKHAILAKDGRIVALFMPCRFRKPSVPDWRLVNTDLPLG